MTRRVELGIHSTLLAWVCSYLSRICQHVIVNGQSCSSKYVLSDVSQGSVLGPLLFLIYMDTILSLELSGSSHYAYDVLLYKPIVNSSSSHELRVDINNISLWTSINSDHPPLLLNNQNLEQVKQYKYLGVTISSNLPWSPHTERICKSAKKKLGIIFQTLPHHLTLFHSCICCSFVHHLSMLLRSGTPTHQRMLRFLRIFKSLL